MCRSDLPPNLDVRFWLRVQKSDTCWEWTGARLKYGLLSVKGRPRWAHRVSWVLTYGTIPPGLCVLHHCDNPPCVRPDHLFLGTTLENIADRDRKGRQARGDRSGVRLHPECLKYADDHWTHQHPERLIRGDKHWTHVMPERLARGDRSGPRLHPELLARGDRSGARTKPWTVRRGERVNTAKLTGADVRSILDGYATGETHSALAARFDVNPPAIWKIVHGRTWKHISRHQEALCPL